MPAPGDQFNNAPTNPFLDQPARMFEYTAQEIATLQCRLDKQLGPEYISSRPGQGGQKVHYVSGEKVIALANEVFGFNGWSSAIRDITVDFVDEHPQTLKISLGLSVIVRVTLRDGTFHEDVGYGHIENCKGKAAAFEKAKKEGTTDGLKRALRTFGNVLGNCIRDKDYLARVAKMKAGPSRFDEAALHRPNDFVKKEAVVVKAEVPAESFDDLLEDFDEADFGVQEYDEGSNDDTILTTSGATGNTSGPPSERAQGVPSKAVPPPPQRQNQQPGRPPVTRTGPGYNTPQTPNHGAPPRPMPAAYQNRQQQQQQQPNLQNQARPPPAHQPAPPPPGAGGAGLQNSTAATEPAGFFSARAVKELPDVAVQGSATGPLPLPHGQQAFNPKAESPSIRKTPGIDHSSSKPVGRNGQHVAPTASQQGPVAGAGFAAAGAGAGAGGLGRPTVGQQQPPTPVAGAGRGGGNVVNPQLDQTRRIGAPGGGGSPLANRGSYRPPTMKRPAPGEGVARPVLAEVPVNGNATGGGAGAGVGMGPDAKRMKM